MRAKLLAIILLVSLTIVMTGCKAKDPLLGKWIEPSTGIMMEFMEDGSLIMGRGGVSYTVAYEKQDPNIILFKASTDGTIPNQSMLYKIEDDHLILTVDGIDTVFNRKK
jgi:hypothetical protein